MNSTKFREEYGGWKLSHYIAQQQCEAGEANACDYKPTSVAELERIASDTRRLFENCCKLLDSIPEEDQNRLERFARLCPGKVMGREYGGLNSFSLANRDPTFKNHNGDTYHWINYVGPSWLASYDEYLKYKEVFK